MRAVVLSTEEEGIGLAAGAWLGGERSVLLMQSSGVGNVDQRARHGAASAAFRWSRWSPCAASRASSTPGRCRWARRRRAVLEAMGTVVHRAGRARRTIAPTVNAALRLAYNSYASVAVLIPQRVIGIKSFQEQTSR